MPRSRSFPTLDLSRLGAALLAEGDDDWQTPLAPATLELVEVWDNGAWPDITPGAWPWGGYDLPGSGPHRIMATVDCGDWRPSLRLCGGWRNTWRPSPTLPPVRRPLR